MGDISSTEPILRPLGTQFGRTIGQVRSNLVNWIVPFSGARHLHRQGDRSAHTDVAYVTDDDGHVRDGAINRLAEAVTTQGVQSSGRRPFRKGCSPGRSFMIRASS